MTIQRNQLQGEQVQEMLTALVAQGLTQAAENLTQMFGAKVNLSNVHITARTLADLSGMLPNPEEEAVGIFVMVQGEVPFQSLLVIPADAAVELADTWLQRNPKTDPQLDELARSALREAGNIVSAAVLMEVSKSTRRNGMPTSPVLLSDMLGALVDLLLTSGGRFDNPMFLIDAEFVPVDSDASPLPLQYWMLPQLSTLNVIATSNRVA